MNPEEFIEKYEAALATQNWQSVAPLIHKDACVTFSSGEYFQGTIAVQKAFERNFKLIEDEKYAISDLHWVRKSEKYAVCTYAFHWQGLIDGKPASGSGRGTTTIIQEDGKWLLLAEHLGPSNK